MGVVLLLASCTAQERQVTTTTTRVEESTTTAPAIEISNLHEEPAENSSFVNVAGTVINNGSAPVTQLTVRVDQMDQFGQVMDSVETPALPQPIAPNGGRAQFSARMSSMHLVHYMAFVVGR